MTFSAVVTPDPMRLERRQLEKLARQDLAVQAHDIILEAYEQNERVAHAQLPPPAVYVDGTKVPALDIRYLSRVKATGQITAIFEGADATEALTWIEDQLETHSPVGSGRYQASHYLFADGEIVTSAKDAPSAKRYIFQNAVPYARKIEHGLSSQAPDGVYEVVAVLARRKFRQFKITFDYLPAAALVIATGRDDRQPSIIVEII